MWHRADRQLRCGAERYDGIEQLTSSPKWGMHAEGNTNMTDHGGSQGRMLTGGSQDCTMRNVVFDNASQSLEVDRLRRVHTHVSTFHSRHKKDKTRLCSELTALIEIQATASCRHCNAA